MDSLRKTEGRHIFCWRTRELQIELDRRLIQEKIKKIKKRLKNVSKRRSIQRKLRNRNNFKIFAIVGYTNAGKTQLFNQLTKQKKESANKLFATLDTKISRVFLKNNLSVGLIDTVGFINNIPTQLIESFKATLEEINESDHIINVVDINDINFQSKINTTKKILQETGVSSNKINNMITVFNKIDLQNKVFKNSNIKTNYVSALTGDGLDELKEENSKKYLIQILSMIILSILFLPSIEVILKTSPIYLNSIIIS